jgi:anti-anti-sigma factor
MAQPTVRIDIRSPAEGISILEIEGDITAGAEEALFAAYNAAGGQARAIILNLSEVSSIDSMGAGLLIALLARVRKQGQRLLAYGLSEHCRRAFALTHLDEGVRLCGDEAEALGSS